MNQTRDKLADSIWSQQRNIGEKNLNFGLFLTHRLFITSEHFGYNAQVTFMIILLRSVSFLRLENIHLHSLQLHQNECSAQPPEFPFAVPQKKGS